MSLRDFLTGISPLNSPAHLELLSRFIYARPIAEIGDAEFWKSVLGERLEKAIGKMQNEGLLEGASVSGAMDFRYKVPDLKEMLRQHDLPTSGRKADLIARLVTADPIGMEKATQGTNAVQCSQRGGEAARQYLSRKAEQQEEAKRSTFEALLSKRFENACGIMVKFEAAQPIPRGMGIDWNHHEPSHEVSTLMIISTARPKILGEMPEPVLEPLRLVASMAVLWGTHTESKWLPANYEIVSRFDVETAARMILFYAQNQLALASFRESGVRTVEVSSVCGCDACSKLQGRVYPIGKVPELPYETCSFEIGCRCLVLASDFGHGDKILKTAR